jgi:crotonobetainyl-CoA:carnitine CoA-transferase CaiB-like acyl-CoA transferase
VLNGGASGEMTGALEGTKVLDLSRLLPGPYCSMILADHGADVLRVEAPHFAAVVPFPLHTLHRNKRHMSLNLKTDEGRQIFYQLARGADVVLEGFRPGVAARLGVDYETLRGLNPHLVYCSISGYGQTGPRREMVGHDVNYLAYGGLLGLMGPPGAPPLIPGTQVADLLGGLNAAVGILLALLARGRTGEGQFVDVGMADGVAAALPVPASFYWLTGRPPAPADWLLAHHYPFYNTYETADGQYIALGALESHFWQALCDHLGRPEYAALQYDEGRREEMMTFLRQTFKRKTRDEWLVELRDLEICVAPVLELSEVFGDEQTQAREMITTVMHPTLGEMPVLGVPIKLSDTPGKVRTPPAEFGEHTREVLRGLGYSDAEIERFEKEGVV